MSDISFSTESFTALSAYGWDERWDDLFQPHAAAGLVPGRIVRVDRGRCDVITVDGDRAVTVQADISRVRVSDPMEWACTGDWVALDADAGAVASVLPRRTAMIRSTSSKRSEGQVLAANVDKVLVAVSLAVDLDLGRLERFLALAWESGAEPMVVLTKADLAGDAAFLQEDAAAAAPGVQVVTVSATTGEGMDVLTALVTGATTVLIGSSGAGKSTLANTLFGDDVQEVNHTRAVDGKGRHTTVRRDLLPLPFGGVLIDTPGLRGVGLFDAEAGLHQVFSEIEELASRCRFQDCAHAEEPGCAVLEAVELGELPQRRLESYRKLLRENEWIASRTDARLRAQRAQRWRVLQKSVRNSGVIRKR